MAIERKIGARVFRCEQLPATEALALFGDLSRLFDPFSMATIRDGTNRKVACENYLALAMQADRPEELQAFIVKCAELCTVGGDKCVAGVHAASIDDVVEVAFFALEAQFKGFLAVALAANMSGESAKAA